ncbi:SEL1-like repeat protein [Burkholderia multivorans]|uniref:tetratricopeptide repeat protein n=1 Tax=Burkholderia multivorans TaxID=87883 RepID=UPI0020A3EA2B|nr:sel1 repeat family protein [Burkholderia multivorans]MCO8575770.1 SEL1-like repeat protein [Burkholderia multivorans]
MYRRLLAPGLLLLLVACVQNPAATSGTVRICDDTGCSDRPKDQVSYQKRDDPDEREDPRIALLKQAAKAQPKAAYDLGLRYFRGDGVRQDSYQALKWMRDAAERGDLNAQKALGGFYLFGLEEMGSDPREAEKWLSIAVARGDKESKKLLDMARSEKKADEEDWKWRTQWRDVYYGYWYSGYPYYGVWRQTYWYGY